MRHCYSDNTVVITEFVRFVVLFDRLNYLAVVREVNFQYHKSSLERPKQTEKRYD